MDKIKQLFADSKQVNFTLAWAIRLAILLLLVRLTFWSGSVNNIHMPADTMRDSIAILNYRIAEIIKKDSILLHNEKQVIDNISTMPLDSVADVIAKHIRQREVLYAE